MQSPQEIAKLLTQLGIEVDSIESKLHPYEGVERGEVFSVSLTPNLGHAMSVRGIARELSAVTGISLTPVAYQLKERGGGIQEKAKISVLDEKACPRYACRVIEGVRVGPSPGWLVSLLQAVGMRSINNVVDVTNFVMLERGHPLHAFDADCVTERHVLVRPAYEGESFTTLDGQIHTLTEDMLVIADPQRALAIAGVMGGENSEVGQHTQNILLESAYFLPSRIRKTSKHLGISTDSSKRFERGTDPNSVLEALDRAAFLIQQLAQGSVAEGVIDSAKHPFLEKTLVLRIERLNQILGTNFTPSVVQEMFTRLDFRVFPEDHVLRVVIPTYRNDLDAEIDLIEEVARLHGYQNIPKTGGSYSPCSLSHSPEFLFERMVRNQAVALGLQEWMTCDLIGPTLLEIVPDRSFMQEEILKVINPTSVDQSILRISLLPGMLEACKRNLDYQNHDLQAFEIGRIHYREADAVHEPERIGILLTGAQKPHHWEQKPTPVDFYDIKGIVESFCQSLGIPEAKYINMEIPELHSGRQACLLIGTREIGWLGEVHPSLLRQLGIGQRVYFAQLFLPELRSAQVKEQRFAQLSIYPSSDRDWTVCGHKQIPIAAIFNEIRRLASPLLETVSLLDRYCSEKLGPYHHNLTFHFVYRDRDKTVEQDEVETEHRKLVAFVADWMQEEERQINL